MSGVRLTSTDLGLTVVLDRPGRRNALTLPMWVDLGRAARGGDQEPLYLVGAGGYFCSGADLGTLAWARESPVHADAFVDAVVRCLLSLHASGREVVAVVEGGAAGGGVEIMAACHRRVVVGDAELVFPFGHHGMTLDDLTRWRLHQLVGPETAERLVDGRHVLGVAEAERLGLVDERHTSWAAFVEAERAGDGSAPTPVERYLDPSDDLDAAVARAAAPMRRAFPPHPS
ncbi:enoyl-CoA hydratase/isomerase family protein [Ornithinimicrobium cerasi]|uniref:2-(1,2-epoxy-1,2-dihydrophenyl)acetyl-CoA isomerase n=1 Tax=Ornithinimicrobium cerasi TaxID=2248773 RepID=A0A285VD57_9MICO|nr:enoyl-CoA hydratase/isomerase family protein [Ornithinimicrobium cerasi]SOC51498.1 2-(1,2-epoxy-1,2-dihydrophenyl)acetyl-CoA isomerase [Ornithinimicrobium cerasi]